MRHSRCEAVEILHAESNPFSATIGLRIDPAPIDSGTDFRLQVDPRTVPMYAYKSRERFAESMGGYVRRALREGLFGWQVTDCTVTMTRCTYQSPDGPPATRGSLSTPADFRKLTPLVLMQALERAGTVVCEPVLRVRLEMPTMTIGAVLAVLARLGAVAQTPSLQGELATIEDSAARSPSSAPAAAATGADGRRRRARVRFRRLPGGQRRATDAAASDGEPPKREEYLMHFAFRLPALVVAERSSLSAGSVLCEGRRLDRIWARPRFPSQTSTCCWI